MMKLLSNPLSPYGRKVKLTMAMKGLKDKIEVVGIDTNPGDNVEINSANPLAKIPCLVVDGRDRHLRQPRDLRVPRQPDAVAGAVPQERAGALQDAGAGLARRRHPRCRAAAGLRERFRPEEKWHAPWQARQRAKIDRAVDQLEKPRRPGARAPTTAT